MHLKHQPEMQMMVEHEILLADKIEKENDGNGKKSINGSQTF